MSNARIAELGRRMIELEQRARRAHTRATNPVGDFAEDKFAMSALEDYFAAERELGSLRRKIAGYFRQRADITVRGLVLDVLCAKPEKTWALSQISARVDASYNAIRQALHVLVREGEIERVDRALYRQKIKHTP